VRSGALITAGWALEQGRECFLTPGPIGTRTTAGSLHFLREQAGLARIVAGLPELLEDLGFAVAAPSPVDAELASRGDLGAAERLVLDAVDDGVGTVDQLVARTGLETAAALGADPPRGARPRRHGHRSLSTRRAATRGSLGRGCRRPARRAGTVERVERVERVCGAIGGGATLTPTGAA
jgi:hypothetical protein